MITSLIFFPEKTWYEKPENYGFDYQDVSIRTEDNVTLHAWHLKAAEPKGILLFFHGNAGNISGRLYKAKGWMERGFSVLLLDYRGYGKSEGDIQKGEDIVRDAQAAFKWLQESEYFPLTQTVLYGESLGSYAAVRLAGERAVAAVVLEAPFTSFLELAKIHYALVPGKEFLLQDFQFSNAGYVERIKAPVFFIHGTNDEVCPYEMSGELFEKVSGAKAFFSIPNGAHNDLPIKAGEDYWDKPYQFVMKYVK